eukprot:1138497-Pelagomonas_calceolata.AAC.1
MQAIDLASRLREHDIESLQSLLKQDADFYWVSYSNSLMLLSLCNEGMKGLYKHTIRGSVPSKRPHSDNVVDCAGC